MTHAGSAPAPSIREVRELASARRWRELVEALDGTPESRLLATPELAVHYADGLWRVGRAARSAEVARGVEPMLRTRGERSLTLNAMNVLGIALFEIGEVDGAAATFGDLLEQATEWEDHDFAARASNNLGVHASIQNRYDLALSHYERALASYIRGGGLRGIAQTHYNLGVNYRELGFHDKAESHYRQATTYGERAESEDVIGLAESDRGLLGIEMGDPRLGRVFAERARARFRRLGDPVREGEAMRVLGMAARADGSTDEARQALDGALEIADRHANRLLSAEVQLERGRLFHQSGDLAAAREALLHAVADFKALGATHRAAGVVEELSALG